MDKRTDSPVFCCGECGSVSIAVEAPCTETSAVTCCDCRAYLGPWCLFLDVAQIGVADVQWGPAERAQALD